MTRAEHLKWCCDRAKAEFRYSGELRQGCASLLSDLRKHEETASLLDEGLVKTLMAIPLESDDTAFWRVLEELRCS